MNWEESTRHGVTYANVTYKDCMLNVSGWRTYGFTASVNGISVGVNDSTLYRTMTMAKCACIKRANYLYTLKQEIK